MSEFENYFHELDQNPEFQASLLVIIESFLLSKKFGSDFAEEIRDSLPSSLGTPPRVSIEKSTEINFHKQNMQSCENLIVLKEYADKNEFLWPNDEEMAECKKNAIRLMADLHGED